MNISDVILTYQMLLGVAAWRYMRFDIMDDTVVIYINSNLRKLDFFPKLKGLTHLNVIVVVSPLCRGGGINAAWPIPNA